MVVAENSTPSIVSGSHSSRSARRTSSKVEGTSTIRSSSPASGCRAIHCHPRSLREGNPNPTSSRRSSGSASAYSLHGGASGVEASKPSHVAGDDPSAPESAEPSELPVSTASCASTRGRTRSPAPPSPLVWDVAPQPTQNCRAQAKVLSRCTYATRRAWVPDHEDPRSALMGNPAPASTSTSQPARTVLGFGRCQRQSPPAGRITGAAVAPAHRRDESGAATPSRCPVGRAVPMGIG